MNAIDATSSASIWESLSQQSLLREKEWKYSPDPWPLTPGQVKEIVAIGQACRDFFHVLDRLYRRAASGENLLRNRPLKAPWVADYLDRGKPQYLIEPARSKPLVGQIPRLMRPDLIQTADGFVMAEIELLPGGIGLTAFLNRLYQKHHGSIVGGGDQIVDCFYRMLAAAAPNTPHPRSALLISDRDDIYRPEMEWLAAALRDKGKNVWVARPAELRLLDSGVGIEQAGRVEKIDVIYRFWELFEDLAFVPPLLQAVASAEVAMLPHIRPFQEEKLNFALFHHPQLQDVWEEHLSASSYALLQRVIPHSWIVDPAPLPPGALLDAPRVREKQIWRWEQLGEMTQKERHFVLKMSGFHKNASGSRSVMIGHDVSQPAWQQAIQQALAMSGTQPHILQAYHKPQRTTHPVFGASDQTRVSMEGRVRLSPYFFIHNDSVSLSGILATFCPVDKKRIHGMKDAVLLPCQERSEEV